MGFAKVPWLSPGPGPSRKTACSCVSSPLGSPPSFPTALESCRDLSGKAEQQAPPWTSLRTSAQTSMSAEVHAYLREALLVNLQLTG